MSDLSKQRQQQRLKFIDLCAYALGRVNRKTLMTRFDIKQAWSTKDFNEYQSITGNALAYDHGLRAYKPVDWFSPLFEHKASDAIQLLADGSQLINCLDCSPSGSSNYSIASIEPELSNINCVLRALYLGRKTEISYLSVSSGESSRIIVPHSLIRTGSFQYVRAFDHKSGEFRSFKLNRIIHSQFSDFKPLKSETQAADEDWNKEVTLKIVVNRSVKNKEAIEFDFGLVNGQLNIQIKKAMIMYFLMDWNIAPIEYPDLPSTLFPLRIDCVNE
jgi:hypothetical protein